LPISKLLIAYNNSMKTISVFGGSQPKPGSTAYLEAQELGRLLANEGYAVQTGGYIGTMEAISRGASEAGGHVIGVTCDEIENWRPVGPNPWIKEEKRCQTLRERLFVLIDDCDGAIALPGGIGTLAEIGLTMAQFQISPDNLRPLILVGNGWEAVFREFFERQANYIPAGDQNRTILVPDIRQIITILKTFLQ
jgi:uncharacterized protein (TIGR00730 family)